MRFGHIFKLLETKGLFHFLSINLSGKMKIKLPIFVTLAYFYRQGGSGVTGVGSDMFIPYSLAVRPIKCNILLGLFISRPY